MRKAKHVSRLSAKGRWVRLSPKDFKQGGAKLSITRREPLETRELATFRIE